MGRQYQRWERLGRLSDGPYGALTILYARRYLRRYPTHGVAWLMFGIAFVELARYEEAHEAFAKALEFCPEGKQQIVWAQMGHLYKHSGDYECAAKWFRKAAAADPDDAEYHIYLGAVLARQGRLCSAEEEHRIGTRCTKGCIDEAYVNLGFVLRAQERFREAAECFRRAIDLDPNYTIAREALRDVEKCIEWRRRLA